MEAAPPAALLLRLLRANNGTLSGEEAAARLDISRAAVWKQVEALRQMGYVIEGRGRGGYHLVASPNAPLPTEVEPLLQTSWLGRPYHYLQRTASTNADLSMMAAAGAPDGTVMVAEEQTAGRGRMARGWHSPPGTGLYFSILLRPKVELSQVTSLPLVAGLAVATVAATYAKGCVPMVKWPNDILVNDRKLCGILCEMTAETDGVHHLIVGIGLNVNATAGDFPPAVREHATSLKLCGGTDIRRAQLLAVLLLCLENFLEEWQGGGLAPFMERLRRCDLLHGRRITIERNTSPALTGTAAGINGDGSLRLLLPDGSCENVYSGDAHIGHIGQTGAFS